MAVSQAYTVSLVVLKHATTDVTIGQLDSSAVNPNITNALLAGAGLVDATFATVQEGRPVVSITTAALKTVMDVCGISGTAIGANETYTDVEVYLQKVAERGARVSGANHIKMTINEGLLIPRTINGTQGGGPATISLELFCTYDGTNDPIAYTSGQSLPSVASASEAYVAGPVTVNGTMADGVQSSTVDFGITEWSLAGDGDVYPTFVAIGDRRPRISFTSNYASLLTTVGIGGTAVDASNCKVYYRKATENGTRVADATSEHIAITVDDGMIQPADTTYSHGDAAAQGYDIIPTFDGSNDVLALSTTSAITS